VIGRQRLCVIDGLTVREGETTNGFVVRQVLTDRVVIARGPQQFELRLELKPADQRAAGAPAYAGPSARPGHTGGQPGAFYEPAAGRPSSGGGGGPPPPHRPGPGGGPRGPGPR
jgi:hypothetical protein